MRAIVAVDESACARNAADIAIDLASRRPGMELTAVHIVNVVKPSGNLLKDLPGRLGFEPAVVSEEVGERHDEEGRIVLAAVKERAAAQGIELRSVLDHGAVNDRLSHHAGHADLLVLGQTGETNERFPGQGGATAHHLVSETTGTKLLVRPHGRPIRRVLVGYDGSEAASHGLSLIRRLGPSAVQSVHAVWVDTGTGDDNPLGQIESHLDGFDVTTSVLTGESVSGAISAYAKSVDIDTIAIGFSGKSAVHDFFFGRGYETLLAEQEFNLLIAH